MEFVSLFDFFLLALAGIAAGALNAVAGGGTFLTFPILIFMGIPPILANTTNKVGIWCGSLASIGGYWHEIKANKPLLIPLSLIAALGSIGGSLMLLKISNEQFMGVIPWIIMIATLVFGFGKKMLNWLKRPVTEGPPSTTKKLFVYSGQLITGIYGGFFGAGIGILMMALYEMMGVKSIHQLNGLKVLVATAINAVSVATFIITGSIIWPAAIALVIGTLIGGYYGATLAKRLPQSWVRNFVVVYGLGVSLYFFLQ